MLKCSIVKQRLMFSSTSEHKNVFACHVQSQWEFPENSSFPTFNSWRNSAPFSMPNYQTMYSMHTMDLPIPTLGGSAADDTRERFNI